MAHQLMAILNKSAVCMVQLRKSDYTWTSADGLHIEVSGLILCAIIMARLKPHYKVDIYTEIGMKKR